MHFSWIITFKKPCRYIEMYMSSMWENLSLGELVIAEWISDENPFLLVPLKIT